MPVRVTPETFSMVNYDSAVIAATVEKLIADVGLPTDTPVSLEVDERVPLGKAEIRSVDPIELFVEGGAIEDAKRPREFSSEAALDVVGRLLMEVRDRLDPAFGAPPLDEEITVPVRTAWEIYAVGRLSRRGHRGQRQRRLYAFRTRHGFTDVADAAFESLWSGDGLCFADVVRISESTRQMLR
ncbi:MAG: hypothetical protein N2037_07365 [Acidimicrobiales bacterium]|nr:hypothetical protein [Acidimicrobiales bacterium]